MSKKISIISLVMVMLSIAACVTVNIYFPAAKVEKTAESIVDDVYGTGTAQKQEQKQEKSQEQLQQSSAIENLLAVLTVQKAQAAELTEQEIESLKQSNSAIRGLKNRISQNHKQLLPYYNAGNVGISNDGYLVIHSKAGLGIKDTAKLRRLIADDNNNRQKLYAEVAASMNIPGSEIAKVKSIFTKVWQKRAPSGWWIQNKSGAWIKK